MKEIKEIPVEVKKKTLAIDFDGVIHKYSKGFKGLYNAYDVPMEGVEKVLKRFKEEGYRLVVMSSRPVSVIIPWLKKYKLFSYFDDVTNQKIAAKYYIDDHALRFESWDQVENVIMNDKD